MTLPANAELNALHQQAVSGRLRAADLVANCPPDAFLKPPANGGWSAAQCFDHMTQTIEVYRARLPVAISTAKAAQESSADGQPSQEPWQGSIRHTLLGKLFNRFVDPQSKMKLKAPPSFQPSIEAADADAAERFERAQSELISWIEQADGVDLNGHRFSSPVSRLIRFNIGDALALLVRHSDRHLGQAERAIAANGS